MPPNGFYTEESTLHAVYSDDGRLITPLDLRIVGDVDLIPGPDGPILELYGT